MIIKRPHTIPLIGTTNPINPLHKEKPSLPLMVRIGHVRYHPYGSLTTHKVVKTLGSGNFLGFVAVEKVLQSEGTVGPTKLSAWHLSLDKDLPSI